MTDPADLPATEAARRLRDGRLTAAALMEATLARIAAREPVVRAFAHLDLVAATRAAMRADAEARAGRHRGKLHGLTLGVKDVLDTAEMPSQYGSPIWAGHRPRSDAAAVALARHAGAIVVGKTVTTEFATRHPGPTTNPTNPAHTPGGSSSGSAAGVAAGFFQAGYGTQTAGSIVRPAAYCGAVGYKPSWGTLHRAGMKVMSESLDTIGVLARTVGDCALFLGAAAGLDLGDPARRPDRPPRLGLCVGTSAVEAAHGAGVREHLEAVAADCRRAGAEVVPFALPAEMAAVEDAHPYVMNMESAAALCWELDHAAAQLSDVLREKLEWARQQPQARLAEGRAAFAAGARAFDAAMAGFDAVLTPSAPGEAPAGLGSTGDPTFNLLWTALHVPCVTVPAGTGPNGLPLGAQVVTRRGEDAAALAWAEWVRQALS